MKTTLKSTFVVLLLITGFMANNQLQAQDHTNLANKIAISKAKWLELKKKWGNSYTYKLTFSSGEGAFSTLTTVQVKNGKVIKASTSTTTFSKNSKTTTKTLNAQELKRLKTLDEVYAFAEKDLVKRSPKQNYITFRLFANGLMSAVGYFPKNCADDCFEGFKFDKIAPSK